MNYFLIQAILIANIGDEESTFWIQILVFLFVAVSLGVYSLIKNNRSEHKDQQQNIAYTKSRWRFQLPHKPVALRKGIVQEYIARMKGTRHHIPNLSQEPKLDFDSLSTASQKNPKNTPATEKNKDLQSGMELLESDFLLSIVENTKGNDQNDVTTRKLNFNEVLRREKLSQVKSKALTVYAINRGNLYGKDIQCEAMGELAERTMRMNRHEALQPAVSPRRRGRMVVM
ncbi:hypothetical protein ES708_12351 [subsurface metagenome]